MWVDKKKRDCIQLWKYITEIDYLLDKEPMLSKGTRNYRNRLKLFSSFSRLAFVKKEREIS